MKNVNVTINQLVEGSVVQLCTTGVTINFNTSKQHYIRTTVYQKMYGISDKTLERYREKIETGKPVQDHKLYFAYVDGRYWYTKKMLEFRKYNTERNTSEAKPVRKQIVNGNETHRSGIINWINGKPWSYKCMATYDGYVSFDQCARKMQKLHTSLTTAYPGSTVTLFYATEENAGSDGFHNHFLVYINGGGSNKKETIKRKIKSIGAGVLECERYDEQKGEDFVRYITKQLERNPECTDYLTNEHQTDLGANSSPCTDRVNQLQPTMSEAA